jgi:hypothetical protein
LQHCSRRIEPPSGRRGRLHHYHNKQCGIKWVDVTSYIEEYALGRKLTKHELKRFLEQNILTIDRNNRKRP